MSERISILLALVAALVAVTNIIVQVIKPFTEKILNTNWVALIVSMTVTFCALGAYAAINGIVITWYLVLGAVVVGFMVAYAAMFGFDKLKQALEGV